ncbi:MAG: transporter substrate-binding domain-containing protein [Clostridiales bacterium]|nr:transporter substrate-binding domain-containing protein [Clostridiales bacterium]
MKKLLSIVSALALTLAVTSCGGGANTTKSIASIDDLNGAKIGVQLGTTGDIYASDVEGATVERYNKGADAVQALKQGKVDCVIIDEQPAKAFVDVNEGLKILEEDFANEEYAICISKENTELKDKINAAIAKFKADGTLDNIVKNYIGDDTKGQFPYTSPEGVDRSNGTLTVATNAEFEPWEYMENNECVGIDMDLAQAVADELGMELQIDNIAFDSIITAVQSGKDMLGIAGMTVTEDRLQNIDFTDTYANATQVIIVPDAE